MSDRPRPNIVILYSDQHRADAVGYEHGQVKTPHLDRLADSGTVFSNCYCQYPVCSPSRASFVTGQYVHTHGVLSNNAGLHPQAPMFPRLLRQQGYSTASIGKMHFYPTYAQYGLDHMELAEQNGQGRYEDDYHEWLANQGALDLTDLIDQEAAFRQYAEPEYWDTYGAQTSNLPEELHSTTWIGDRAVSYLERAEPPFCLWAGFIKPHHPFDPPADWLKLYKEDELEPLPGWTETISGMDTNKKGYFDYEPLTLPRLRRVMAHYYATISHIDAQIGRLLEVLERRGLEDTIIIYTADHGELLGYHHLLGKGDYLYDPLVQVPLTITSVGERSWPRNQRTSAMVESIDVTSTILALAGIEPPPQMQGIDLLPVLRGERDHHREAVFSQNRGMGTVMLRTQRWKLIEGGRAEDGKLFDLDEDPTELRNLYEDPSCSDIRREYECRLLRHLCGHFHPLSYSKDSASPASATARELTPYADLCRDALQSLEQGGKEESPTQV